LDIERGFNKGFESDSSRERFFPIYSGKVRVLGRWKNKGH
jgi:hypothetical protein